MQHAAIQYYTWSIWQQLKQTKVFRGEDWMKKICAD